MLGLLTEFRDQQTKRVTKWGKIPLAGILISSALGMAAQFGESYEKEQKDQKDARAALVLAQKTDANVTNIQRILTPLDDINVTIDLKLHCDQNPYDEFCKSVISHAIQFRDGYDDDHTTADDGYVESLGVSWHANPPDKRALDGTGIQPGPIKPADIRKVMKLLGTSTPTGVIVHSSSTWWSAWPTWPIGQNVILSFDISVYARSSGSIRDAATPPSLHGDLVGTTLRSVTKLEARYDFDLREFVIRISGLLEDLSRGDGTMVSTLDLPGSTRLSTS